MMIIRFSLVVILTATITACGGSSGTTPFSDAASSGRTPWDTGGILTMSEASAYTGDIVGIFDMSHESNRGRTDLAVGTSPWRHPDGTLYYLAECGRGANYIAVMDATGDLPYTSPCSSDLPNIGYSPTLLTHVMASPDHRRMAVETRWFDRDLQRYHDTVVFEDRAVIATYENYYAAAWVDNDTLVMVAHDGLYTASVGGTPVLLNNAAASDGNTYFNNPDVSPDGKQVVYEWNDGAIWVMDIDGGGARELANDSRNLRYPAWSPDGQFVAFMRNEAPGAYDHHLIPTDPLNFAFLSNVNERLIHYVDVNTLERFIGYFNEHMANDKMPQSQLSWTAETSAQ